MTTRLSEHKVKRTKHCARCGQVFIDNEDTRKYHETCPSRWQIRHGR